MPRLNLDIFSPADQKEKSREEKRHNSAAGGRRKQNETGEENTKKEPVTPRPKDSSPKFVPVGFYPQHLRLLDDAVIKLRRMGHWRASKSAIIRKSISEQPRNKPHTPSTTSMSSRSTRGTFFKTGQTTSSTACRSRQTNDLKPHQSNDTLLSSPRHATPFERLPTLATVLHLDPPTANHSTINLTTAKPTHTRPSEQPKKLFEMNWGETRHKNLTKLQKIRSRPHR